MIQPVPVFLLGEIVGNLVLKIGHLFRHHKNMTFHTGDIGRIAGQYESAGIGLSLVTSDVDLVELEFDNGSVVDPFGRGHQVVDAHVRRKSQTKYKRCRNGEDQLYAAGSERI